MMISAYLLYKRMFNTPERAIEFFESKRLLPGFKVLRENYIQGGPRKTNRIVF